MKVLQYNLFQAYYHARRNKRGAHNQLLFEIDYEHKLFTLYDEIKEGQYTHGKSTAFIIEEPVKREIFAADFKDRIVQHLLFDYINPILEPQFIDDSYSCRKGKGTFQGIQKAYEYLTKATDHFSKDVYILKLDIRGYFMSINKNKLMEKLRVMIPEKMYIKSRSMQTGSNILDDLDYKALFDLLETVVYHAPQDHCVIRGNLSDWKDLPDSKSLFKSSPNCGLPIGNLTSQLLSNVYLNTFDHYIKDKLKIEYYGRYVDDFYIFHSSKTYLKKVLSQCRKFLLKEGLVLHPKKIYLQHYTKGFLFLGAYIKPHRIYMGKRTVKRFKNKIYNYRKSVSEKKEIPVKELESLRSVMNSYLGQLSHYNTYRLRYKTLFRYPSCVFFRYGYFSGDLKKFSLYPGFLQNNGNENMDK